MKHQTPPHWMMKFFRWFCREELCEAVEGDLLALYIERRGRMSAFRASTWYFINVITFIQPFAIRKGRLSPVSNTSSMFINHLKIGFRLMAKRLTYSSINVLGLAIGLSAVILIALYIKDELSYDRFHSKGSDIVRVTYRLETPNATRTGAKLPFPIKEVLKSDYPEVTKVARFYHWGGDTPLLSRGSEKHTEDGLYFAENDVFDVFDFELVSGNRSTLLTDPRSIVLTEKLAAKYFGDQDPIGEVVRYKNEDNLVVTGVLKDVPDNSHITFDALLPIELQRQRWMGWGKYTYDLEKDWNWAAAWVYVQLPSAVDRPVFEEKLQAIADEYINSEEQDGFSLEIQSLFDIHLRSDKSAEPRANGNLTQVYGFGIVAALILFIACINFVNLTSAQANERLKEVGLRKIMGAGKTHLVTQFITEALILVTIASLIALILAIISLPFFNQFMEKSLRISIDDLPFLALLIAIAFGVALLSGLRPSLAVIRINAAQRFNLMKSKQRFSKSMVIAQFIVCNLLFTGILVVKSQLDFLQNKDLGFDKELVLILRHGKNLSFDQEAVFVNELAAIPAVQRMHRGYTAGTKGFTNTFKIVGSDDDDTYSLGIKWIGEGFTEMFDLNIIAGRNFNDSIASDLESGILINASTAETLGWSVEESIGQKLSFLPGGASEPQVINVIGVIADANFESLYDPVLPSVFRRTSSSVGGEVSIRLASGQDLLTTLDKIETVWDSVIPEWPFEFTFLDEQIQTQYVKEERLSSAIRYFTILAILIACSGLFGLASFAVQQRTKEIGVRKVLGASISSIFALVSRHFIILIGVSFLLSIPMGYLLFTRWLDDFAYRIEIGPGVFLIAGITSMIMVIIAVGSQSLQAANRDPVETLRYE